MDQAMKDKSAKVLIVENSSTARNQISEIVKSLGFSQITGAPSLKVAIGVLESEDVDWIITSAEADQSENALHLLKMTTEVAEIKHMRFSLLLEESEHFLLPMAFSYGLLSYHKKPFTKESLTEEFNTLLKRYEAENFESSLVAAMYLREFLTGKEDYNDLLAFEKSLLKAYPAKTNLLFNLVLPQAKLGKKAEAKSVLRQIEMLAPDQKERVQSYAKKFLNEESIKGDAAAGGAEENLLGLNQVIFVDSDDAMQKNVTEIFCSIGVKDVHCFSDGEAALKHVKEHKNPHLIIQEWRIPKVPGPLFLQRARSEGADASPFMVLSSLIKKEDVPLLKEMGVAEVVEKPYERHQLLQKLVWMVQQDRCPTDKAALERRMRDHLRHKKLDEANALRAKYLADPEVAQGDKSLCEAEFAFAEGNFSLAKTKALDSLKYGGDSIHVLNLLGKALLKLKELETALRCFEKAQAMSPSNIERLCTMAEVHSELGNEGQASATLNQAKDLDPESKKVMEAEAKVAVNAGNTEKAKAILSQLEGLDDMVSYMNNQAVAYIKTGKFDKGFEYYQKAITSIPEERPEFKAIVLYNLALAYARNDKYDEAKAQLEECIKIKISKVFPKAKSLLKRIASALETGEAVQFHKTPAIPAVAPEAGESSGEAKEGNKDGGAAASEDDVGHVALAAVQAQKGELGCYMIYTPKQFDSKALELIKNPLRFKFRNAITRGEAALKNAS